MGTDENVYVVSESERVNGGAFSVRAFRELRFGWLLLVIGFAMLLPVGFLPDALLVAVCVLCVPYIVYVSPDKRYTTVYVLMSIWAIWAFLAYVVFAQRTVFWHGWMMYYMPLLVVVAVTQIGKNGSEKAVEFGGVIWAALISGQLIYTLARTWKPGIDLHLAADIYWARSNYIAAMLVILILWVYDYRRKVKSVLSKVFVLSVLFISLAALLLTVSRGGLIALLVGLVVYEYQRQTKRAAILLVIFCFAVGTVAIFQQYASRFLQILDYSNLMRIYLYLQAAEKIVQRPIFGYGPGSIELRIDVLSSELFTNDPHNLILKVGMDTGLVGVGVFAVIIVYLWRRAKTYRTATGSPVFVSVLTASLINGQYEPTLVGRQYSFLFWYLMGCMLITTERTNKEMTTRVSTEANTRPSEFPRVS